MRAHDFAALPALADLPEAELGRLASHCTLESADAGEAVFAWGEPMDHPRVILGGRLDIVQREGAREGAFVTVLADEVTGPLPYSRAKVYGGTGRATRPLQMVCACTGGTFPTCTRRGFWSG